MGIWDSFTTYLRTGHVVREARASALQTYSSWETLAPTWGMSNFEAYVREAHRRNALAYACVEYICDAISTPVLRAVRERGDELEDLPSLDPLSRLLERPSTEYPSQTRFVRAIVRSLLLSGEAILYKVRGTKTGQIVELQLLPSNVVAVRREANGRKVYLYHYDPAREPIRLKEEEVIFVKFDDALNRDRGLSPLSAAARETDVDNETATIRKTFFENGAMLQGILSTEQQATKEQLQDWTAMWRAHYSGSKNAGKTPALAGGLSYQEIGSTPDKWAFPEVTGLSEARICSAFGVPPILVGAKIGLDRSTYANYKEARSAFWEDRASAFLALLADEFTGGLTELSDGRLCVWDTSEVPALQEDSDSREQRAGRGLSLGTVTINEYREAAGLEPVEDGDHYFQPTNIRIVAVGEIAPAEVPEVLEEFVEGEEDDDQPEEEDTEDPQEEKQASRSRSGGVPARLPDYRQRALIASIGRLLARAIERVLGRQAESAAEKAEAGETVSEAMLDVEIEAQRMAEAARPHIRSILEEAGRSAAAEEDGSFDADDPTVEAYVEDAPLIMGRVMARRTREIIRGVVEGVQAEDPDGWSAEEIAARLRDTVADRDRADLAAEEFIERLRHD